MGDSAVRLTLGTQVTPAVTQRIRRLATGIRDLAWPEVVDVVPAFACLAVHFREPIAESVLERLRAAVDLIRGTAEVEPGRLVDVPVCYGGAYGPDLADVARHTGLSPDDVVARHAGGIYEVNAIGFAPGFPYLGGLPSELATPRRATPRLQVPAGAVGIGGAQTGVYPLASPGGWNLIGRTPWRLFVAERDPASLLRAGDRVRFRPIDRSEFDRLLQSERLGARIDVEGESSTMPGVHVLKPGLWTTVQDGGRWGFRDIGVPSGGAADGIAQRVANWLVGNPEQAAVLECTLIGPVLEFRRNAVVAVTGGMCRVPGGRPIHVSAGTRLDFGPLTEGCRGYIACAGGFDVAPVLGSRSTYVRGGLGGWQGRALREGDELPLGAGLGRVSTARWFVDSSPSRRTASDEELRVVPGAEFDQFAGDWLGQAYVVQPRSDRMGLRLAGPALQRSTTADLLSAPTAPGTIQVPPDGQPIVLLADAQTIGGYPQVAHVISADLSRLAQARPGTRVRFKVVTLAEAAAAWRRQKSSLARLQQGIAQKLA